MLERHRSPYSSPSRSPWRSSKCPTNKSLRMARRSIWTRAKHRVGLERPHFCTRFRAQSESWVAPAQREASFGARVRGENFGETGEEGRNYVLQLRLHHLLHLVMRISLEKTRNKRHDNEKSDAEKNTRSGGSDPAFVRFQPPKISRSRSRPLRRKRDRVLSACPAGVVTQDKRNNFSVGDTLFSSRSE